MLALLASCQALSMLCTTYQQELHAQSASWQGITAELSALRGTIMSCLDRARVLQFSMGFLDLVKTSWQSTG